MSSHVFFLSQIICKPIFFENEMGVSQWLPFVWQILAIIMHGTAKTNKWQLSFKFNFCFSTSNTKSFLSKLNCFLVLLIHQDSFQHNLNRTRFVHSFGMIFYDTIVHHELFEPVHPFMSTCSNGWVSRSLVRVSSSEYFITRSAVRWTRSNRWESRLQPVRKLCVSPV